MRHHPSPLFQILFSKGGTSCRLSFFEDEMIKVSTRLEKMPASQLNMPSGFCFTFAVSVAIGLCWRAYGWRYLPCIHIVLLCLRTI